MTVPKSTWCDKMSALASIVSAGVDVIDYLTINPHEKRVQIGLDNITKAIAVLNRNLSRSLVIPDSGTSPDNVQLIHSDSSVAESEKIVLEAQTIPDSTNAELFREDLRKISASITKIMSKTVDNPDDLIFLTTETETKNADNLQTLIFSASIGEMKVDLTDLIKQFKMNIGETEYTFAQVLYNLLKVSQDANFKPDNLPESLLAVAAETKDLQVRLVGV